MSEDPARTDRPTTAPSRWDFNRIDGDAAFTAILALLSFSIFLVTPLETTGAASPEIVDGVRFAVAALVFLIVAKRIVSRVLIVATFVATLVFGHDPSLLPHAAVVRPLVALVFDLAIVLIVAASTFRPGFVSTRRILGGIIIYLGLAIAFAYVYAATQAAFPDAFARISGSAPTTFADLLDFSLASLTSIGEAHVTAVNPVMQSLSRLETVIGQLFPATLIARLVGLNAAMAISGAPDDAARTKD